MPRLVRANGNWVTGSFWCPAVITAVFDNVLYHVGAEHARALGNEHLTVGKLVEFYFDFDSSISAAFGPAVLKIVETEYFAFLEGESHAHESSGS